MERESFIFYKSFYEALIDLPKEIRMEVLTAIIEYALYGREPQLKPFASAMFKLVKPNIDNNTTRYVNGTKGGRKSVKPAISSEPAYNLTYEQEVEAMRADEEWKQTICNDFNISAEEYNSRLSRFLSQCVKDSIKKGKTGHDSAADAKSHLRYWMTKLYKQSPSSAVNETDSEPDYTYNGGFGSVDI